MTIGVFMSRGTSLADWARQGILEREVALYRQNGNNSFYLFVPDRHIEKSWRELVAPVQIIGTYSYLPMFRTMRRCDSFRGHNGRALIAPLLASLIFRKPLTLRFGYIWSWDLVHRGVSGLKLWCVLLMEWLACRRATEIQVAHENQKRYLQEVQGVV